MSPTDWIAISAVVATVFTGGLGWLFTYFTQRRQQQHEDAERSRLQKREDEQRDMQQKREDAERVRLQKREDDSVTSSRSVKTNSVRCVERMHRMSS